ncbi:MAG: hypothetical protein AB9882_12925 [Ignavibacteriaceae bacterium]
MFRVVNLLFSFLLALIAFSCSCQRCDESKIIHVSARMAENAQAFIEAYVGAEFYSKYISIDKLKTEYHSPNYLLVYNISIPDKPFFRGEIKFYMDSSGNVITKIPVTGIPNCVEKPENCIFNIDENEARAIAKANYLSVGMKDWMLSVMWNEDYDKYVWYILSTTYESEGSNGFIGDGEYIIIDIGSGKVIEKDKWKVR